MPWLVATSTSFGETPRSTINPSSTAEVIPRSVISFLVVAACNGNETEVCVITATSRMADHLPIITLCAHVFICFVFIYYPFQFP